MLQMCARFVDLLMETIVCRRNCDSEELIAIEDYTPVGYTSALSINKDDRFLLHSEATGNWWKVKAKSSGRLGFAPSRILAKASDLQHFEWISFDAYRHTEEEILMKPEFPTGAFIIRPQSSQAIAQSITLSVKLQNSSNPPTTSVVRFLIKRDGSSFRVEGGQRVFESLTKLVEHHADRFNTSNLRLTFSVKKNQRVTRWEYEDRAIVRGERLSSGRFSEVFKGCLCGRETVAIKTANTGRIDAEDILREAEIARFCKHPNILEIIGICRSSLSIITEYMSNGDLKKYLQSNQISSAECLSVAGKVASAMELLSSEKIVHRDLAARNILVGNTIETIKVADFGLARSFKESAYYTTSENNFPLKWTAPEAFVIVDGTDVIRKGTITTASDAWSFGVVLWELYTNGQDPYAAYHDSEVYNMLIEENYRLPKPSKCSREIYTHMLECWHIDRELRPTFHEIRQYLSLLMTDSERGEAYLSQSDTDDETDDDFEND